MLKRSMYDGVCVHICAVYSVYCNILRTDEINTSITVLVRAATDAVVITTKFSCYAVFFLHLRLYKANGIRPPSLCLMSAPL